MMTHRTVNFGWNTVRVEYQLTCRECNKKCKRTISRGFNDLADRNYILKTRIELKQEADTLSVNKDFTCLKCEKLKVQHKGKEVSIQKIWGKNIEKMANRLFDMDEEQQRIQKTLQAIASTNAGRILIYEDQEYAQDPNAISIYDGQISITAHRINKKIPWETVDEMIWADIFKVKYLDENIRERRGNKR